MIPPHPESPEPDGPDGPDEASARDGADERHVPAAAYAPNWRTVLAVDAGMGAVLLGAGVVLAFVWNPVGGGLMGSLGLVYVVLVARRARAWAALRRNAGF